MTSERQACIFICLSFWAVILVSSTPFDWMARDKWDIINEKFSNVSAANCRSKSKEELLLRPTVLAGIPKYNQLRKSRIFSNRSQLLHVHNMALNRAFFYSLIYQRLNNTWDFDTQPGLMYIYLSAAADVSASEGWVNGSALFFDLNCTYPNWYTTVPINVTLPFFAPRSWREDDYNEPTNFLREPTNGTINIWDMATGNSKNYTDSRYKGNPWLNYWLPDTKADMDSTRKFTYTVGVKYSNVTGKFVTESFEEFNFFGPQQPGSDDADEMLPVRFTQPYFDCGQSNRWIVSASSPVVEYMPRYVEFTHMRRPRFTAVATMDIEFERLDMNQCPLSKGNVGPNDFAGTARCRPTTMCEPLPGFGFRRGGYQCVCNPGYYYPWWHDGPFLGVEIEQATKSEWEVGFDCLSVQDRRVRPTKMPTFIRSKRSVASTKDMFLYTVLPEEESPRLTHKAKRSLISSMKELTDSLKRQRREEETASPRVLVKRSLKAKQLFDGKARRRTKRETVDEHAVTRMTKILNRYKSTSHVTCKNMRAHELFLPGDAAYGVHKQFEAQGRTALRIAHFLSAFLQNVDEYEEFGNLKGDRRLNETQLFAEVLATVMADFKIFGTGVFFDRYKFRMSPPVNNTDPRFVNGITREFFGPYAWRTRPTSDGSVAGAGSFKAMDFAGLDSYYTDSVWFRNMKARWATNFVELKKFTAKPLIRSDFEGSSRVRFEFFPMTYRAPKYEDGEWLRPEFKCDDRVNSWVVTYLAPFFGKDDIRQDIEFKGVVAVDVDLSELVIDQCPGPFHVANAFKNTARCHYESEYCVPSEGQGYTSNLFRTGFYKCECREGFEYPINDLAWYYDGQAMEKEYSKMINGEPNRYETLKCRKAGAAAVSFSFSALTLLTLVGIIFTRS